MRGALALGLAAAAGTAAGTTSEMVESDPPAAEAATGGYPWWNADDCSSQFGASSWCVDENSNGSFSSNEQHSPHGYSYRNCTDWAAERAQQAGAGSVPAGWGNAKNWDDAARATGVTVDNTPEVGDIAQWNSGTLGHVAFVEEIGTGANAGKVRISEYNKSLDGNYRDDRWVQADNYIDLNGTGNGIPGSGDGGSTPPPTQPPFVTHPAAVARGNGMDVFYKEHDGDLVNVGWNPGAPWRSPQDLMPEDDIHLAGNPDAVARDANNMEVAFVDTAGNLRTIGWNSVQNWGEAIIRASNVAGDPEIITRGNGMELFWRTDGGSLMSRGWNPTDGWMSTRELATDVDSNPTAVARGTNDMAVFYRGGKGYDDLYEVSWNVNRSTNGGWTNPNVRVSNDLSGGDPVVISRSNSEMSVFYRDKGNRLDEKGWSAGSGWRPVYTRASNVLSDPSATARGGGAMEIAFKSVNSELRAVGWNSTNGWGTPQNRGNGIYGEPHIINRGTNAMEIFYKQVDDTSHLTDAGWNPNTGWGETDISGTGEIA